MSKLTIVGDPHVKNKNLEQIKELFDFIESFGNPILLTGDVFDTKEVIRGRSLNFVYERIKNSSQCYTILVGNHDYFNLECEDHSLKVLSELENVEIIDKLTVLGENIYGIPYIHDIEKLKNELKNIPKNSILFGHLDVVSFDYGNGYLSESGLQLQDLKKFKKVISGHYHKFQVKENLTYIGTPFSHSFGESNQDKYIGIFDMESHELELVETPFPKHITSNINCDSELPMKFYPDKNFMRLILNGLSENILKFKAGSLIPESVKVIERPTDEFMNNVSIDETADNLVKFKEWASEIKGLDQDTISLGVQILEAVK